MKKFAVIAPAAVMLLSVLAGCGASAEGEASVQSVSMICGLGSTGLVDRFAGMVTSQSETQIKKNDNATVDAIKVKVDQEVKEGDALFTYDMSQAKLDLEKAQLELEQSWPARRRRRSSWKRTRTPPPPTSRCSIPWRSARSPRIFWRRSIISL